MLMMAVSVPTSREAGAIRALLGMLEPRTFGNVTMIIPGTEGKIVSCRKDSEWMPESRSLTVVLVCACSDGGRRMGCEQGR